jgi:hypothetical protein
MQTLIEFMDSSDGMHFYEARCQDVDACIDFNRKCFFFHPLSKTSLTDEFWVETIENGSCTRLQHHMGYNIDPPSLVDCDIFYVYGSKEDVVDVVTWRNPTQLYSEFLKLHYRLLFHKLLK